MLNEIAKQLGIKPIKVDLSNATEIIKAIQGVLGVSVDGLFGSNSVKAYLCWTEKNGRNPILLYEEVPLSTVIGLINNSYRAGTQNNVTMSLLISIIYLESLTFHVRPFQEGPVEFNRCTSPFAMHMKRPTATGLMQINHPTLSNILQWMWNRKDELSLLNEFSWKPGRNFEESLDNLEALICDAMLNVYLGLTLIYMDSKRGLNRDQIFMRWEVWHNRKNDLINTSNIIAPWVIDIGNHNISMTVKEEQEKSVMRALRALKK